MAIVELQVSATDILAIMDTQNLSAANGRAFTVASDNFNVASVTPHPDRTLHYDEDATFVISYQEVLGPNTDIVNGKKTQLSRTYTVALNKVLRDAQGNITMVDGGSHDARVLLVISGSAGVNAPTFVIGIDRIEPQLPTRSSEPQFRTFSARSSRLVSPTYHSQLRYLRPLRMWVSPSIARVLW